MSAVFRCPDEGEAVAFEGHYLCLGRDGKGRLLAIITIGHMDAGDERVEVCDAEVVENREAAARWFAEAMESKPWIKRN